MARSRLIPAEFLELNPRLWSFVFMLAFGSFALVEFPLKPFSGYIDPFYSPTILILPLVGLFRITCYAYRQDYNRHVFKHPLLCPASPALDGSARAYTGETSLFMRVENLHRYFMYIAVAVLPFFYYDLAVSLTYFGGLTLRLGSVFLAVNAAALTLYVFSCHSVRSLFGGRIDCYSCSALGSRRKKAYDAQSFMNRHHTALAWLSLVTIIGIDLYLRAVHAGLWADPLILHMASI